MIKTSYAVIRPGIDHDAFTRYLALVQHVVDTGIPLPMSPSIILQFEDAGAVVDLETGHIDWPAAVAAPETEEA
jgi:acetone carboxylase gamma subunit